MSNTHSQGREPGRGTLPQAKWSTRPAEGTERGAAPRAMPAGSRYATLRIGAFFIATWASAAVLYFGRHSVALIALSGVVALGGFDLFRPE